MPRKGCLINGTGTEKIMSNKRPAQKTNSEKDTREAAMVQIKGYPRNDPQTEIYVYAQETTYV